MVLQAAPVAAARYAAIVVNADTGEVLYARHPDQRRYPASLTKMMTLYLTFAALEEGTLRMGQTLRVSRRAAGQTPSVMGLKRGQTVTVEQAILGLVTKSANDAATVLAEAMAGKEVDFAKKMTERARSLGMTKTRFTNASGLYNRRQVTTARDMVTLALALKRDYPKYYRYFSTRSFTFGTQTFRNHNRLLKRYDGADGIKTGYIRASGFNLAASALRDGNRLVGVVFGGRSSRTRDQHMMDLLDRGFDELSARQRQARALPPLPGRKPVPPENDGAGEPMLAKSTPLPAAKPMRLASAPANPREVGSAPPGGSGGEEWSIQVGAFKLLRSAERRMAQVEGLVPEILADVGIRIFRHEEMGKPVYRVRFTGLNEDDAADACRALKRKRIACVLISPKNAATLALSRP